MEPRPIALACALLSKVCLIPALQGQIPPQTPRIKTSADLVIVPAVVRGSSGDLVQILQASDFVLTDNGVRQSVQLEVSEHQPLSIVVLMQTGASATRELPEYVKLGTMFTYLTAGSPYRIAMVTFDSRPEEQWDFTTHVDDLQDGFTDPHPGDRKAAILDAVGHGIDLLRKEPPNHRRVIVLLSQTHDDGSVTHAEEIIKRLGENNITIECLTFSPERAWLKDQFTKPRQENPLYQFSPGVPPLQHTFNLDKPLRTALSALRENTSAGIAALSGGESLPFASRSDLEQQLANLTNHLASTYTLSFRPTLKQTGFHALQLHIVGHEELRVSARSTYYVADVDR